MENSGKHTTKIRRKKERRERGVWVFVVNGDDAGGIVWLSISVRVSVGGVETENDKVM